MSENSKISEPIIEEVPFTSDGLIELSANFTKTQQKSTQDQYILTYPTVYLIHRDDNNEKVTKNHYTVYVGETNNIRQRTVQHLTIDPKNRSDWAEMVSNENSKMIVIGHEHFNKSMTLDIENQFMLYLSSVETIDHLDNRRKNEQYNYYPANERSEIFSKIWSKLNRKYAEIFPLESIIRDSALFKASPFHKLTDEQLKAKQQILDKVQKSLQNDEVGQLIIVQGEAGSGKTVLLSKLFYEISKQLSTNGQLLNSEDGNVANTDVKTANAYLLVNHDQQLVVYQQIAIKLGIDDTRNEHVNKPTHFINTHSSDDPVDVVLVDEAHLLWTQGKQSYRGDNQLKDLLKQARVVIAVFDLNQVVATNGYWENDQYQEMLDKATTKDNLIELKNQMRIQASSETLDWLETLIHQQRVVPIPKDNQYDLEILSSPQELQNKINENAKDTNHGLSRILATFDWKYVDGKKDGDDPWYVKIGDWKLPWNLQIKPSLRSNKENRIQTKKNKSLAWAEQPQTIREVGSTFTIQGFDLNYAGVIIGPSVKYRNGKIIFDSKCSFNKNATHNRTISDGSKVNVSEELLRNELNILLTRGVHGLYIYAVDDQLQQVLMDAQNKSSQNLDFVAEDDDIEYKSDK
ncbi:DUF2075 domain-containing protein [Lapidilactobacillus bayanensis]|uniref:DUF2075 domain-containing protein n=1 Tax=Lapidilactobacillus bayanensis TaxID=2485998 RepID=UPI000F79051E|nr:DUF2075 domain-containing protein [Lapidilactobacillus bayanensis]